MITIDLVHSILHSEIHRAEAFIPKKLWNTFPKASVSFTHHATRLGEVTAGGQISITPRFIDSPCFTLLRNTLRHELTHCIVGNHHCHNKVFKSVAHQLGVVDNSDLDEELKVIESKTAYKYQVVAHLECGDTVEVGGVHRKTKKYSEYVPTDTHFMSIQGRKVARFEFIET